MSAQKNRGPKNGSHAIRCLAWLAQGVYEDIGYSSSLQTWWEAGRDQHPAPCGLGAQEGRNAAFRLDSGYIQMYAKGVAIIWDPEKAEMNLKKHGIRFAQAVVVLDDPYAVTVIDYECDPGEERLVTLGADAHGRVLLVVHTHRGEDIRLISAGHATPGERKDHEAER